MFSAFPIARVPKYSGYPASKRWGTFAYSILLSFTNLVEPEPYSTGLNFSKNFLGPTRAPPFSGE